MFEACWTNINNMNESERADHPILDDDELSTLKGKNSHVNNE